MQLNKNIQYIQSIIYPMMYKTIIALILITGIYSQYSQELGLNLCHLSIAAYCNPQRLQDWSCSACINSAIKMENVQTFTNSSGKVVGFIGTSSSPSATYIVFRGVDLSRLNSWYDSIPVARVNYPLCNNGCQVHQEFYREYSDFSRNLINAVKEYLNLFQKTRVIIAGHGLGGSFAVFTAAQLVSEGVSVSEVYTYGMPRTGQIRYTSWFDTYVKGNIKMRVTHAHDALPQVPIGLAGFVHLPHEIFYQGKMSQGFVSCNDASTREDIVCADKNFASKTLTDHLNYYDLDFSGMITACQ